MSPSDKSDVPFGWPIIEQWARMQAVPTADLLDEMEDVLAHFGRPVIAVDALLVKLREPGQESGPYPAAANYVERTFSVQTTGEGR